MKKLVFIFAFLFLGIYFANIIYTDSQEEKARQEKILRKPFIDKEEMNRFLPVWSEYLASDVSQIGARQISLTMGKASEKFPLQTIRWLKDRGWNADRFFYVEQRLKAIVKSAFMQEHIKATVHVLETGGVSGVDSVTVQRMIDDQKQRINVEQITPGELDMVMPDLILISDILDGSRPYSSFK